MLVTVEPTAVDQKLRDVLITATGKKVELYQVPSGITLDGTGELIDPYGIIWPKTPVLHDSGLAEAHFMASMPYQLCTVGRNAEHAQRFATACREALLRKTGSAYANPVSPVGHTVMRIDWQELGYPEQAGGGLWQHNQLFTLEVESA